MYTFDYSWIYKTNVISKLSYLYICSGLSGTTLVISLSSKHFSLLCKLIKIFIDIAKKLIKTTGRHNEPIPGVGKVSSGPNKCLSKCAGLSAHKQATPLCGSEQHPPASQWMVTPPVNNNEIWNFFFNSHGGYNNYEMTPKC